MMKTAFQATQDRHYRDDLQKRRAQLQALGAVARVGVVHYRGVRQNISTMLTVDGKEKQSRSVTSDDVQTEIARYAADCFGSGRLRKESESTSGDVYEATFLVFK